MAGMVSVREIMTKDVKVVRPDSSVREVVKKMNKFNISCIVVVQKKRPVGIITERDILRKVVEPCMDPAVVKARETMSSPIVAVDENTSVEEAARLMAKKGIKKLPVVRDNELIGIITSMDIVKVQPKLVALMEELLWTRQKQ